MTDFKKGDRVRVCSIDDYSRSCMTHLGIALPIGRTGTVEEVRFNPNMAVYGLGIEILVRMNDNGGLTLWNDMNLELLA